ncbi:hypothetical protein CC86DRAFT_32377 [Ophiobolus disseminans]|uniref:Uncharacterized protein n=1 Tax=Ophiobolus disseminans TaxID=1469910 RepID=A0A6A6ZYF9_9PLEO|nr:hypothetical protein CC86DRAFT_32377 [Ophiobolus disseminans]
MHTGCRPYTWLARILGFSTTVQQLPVRTTTHRDPNTEVLAVTKGVGAFAKGRIAISLPAAGASFPGLPLGASQRCMQKLAHQASSFRRGCHCEALTKDVARSKERLAKRKPGFRHHHRAATAVLTAHLGGISRYQSHQRGVDQHTNSCSCRHCFGLINVTHGLLHQVEPTCVVLNAQKNTNVFECTESTLVQRIYIRTHSNALKHVSKDYTKQFQYPHTRTHSCSYYTQNMTLTQQFLFSSSIKEATSSSATKCPLLARPLHKRQRDSCLPVLRFVNVARYRTGTYRRRRRLRMASSGPCSRRKRR